MKADGIVVLFLSVVSIVATPALAQAPSTQQNTANQLQALSNKDVLDMQNAGLGADVIVAKIESSTCDFDTSPTALEQLRTAKVPNEVILAMVQAPVASDSARTAQPPTEAKSALQHPSSYLGLFVVNAKPPAHGFLVKDVTPDGPAAEAGIREGDVVEAVNGQAIASIADYQKLSGLDPGTQFTFTIRRNGQESNITTTSIPLHATVTFIMVQNGQVTQLMPNWAINWLNKNWKKYPGVKFQTSGPASGEDNYVIAFSFSSNALNGFQPVTHTDTSESTSNISGTGTATDNNGNSWDYTMNGQAVTTTTSTTTTDEAYTRTYNGVYLTAYDGKGGIIGKEGHVYSTQTGGDQGTAFGYNLGNALGAIHAKDHLMEAILKDIGLVKHNSK